MRLARAIASDIWLYNESKVIQGIQDDTFFQTLSAELAEGRELYNSRVSAEVASSTNFFDRAIVDVILNKKHVKSPIW